MSNIVFTFIESAAINKAAFGMPYQTDARTGLGTGRIPDDEVAGATAHYVEPKCHAEARSLLLEHRMVVLWGPTGSGKRTAAINLLREVATEPLISLSPQKNIRQLARREYGEHGYAIFDHSAEPDRSRNSFAHGILRDRLMDAQAFLVLTTTTKPDESSDVLRYVEWSGPDPLLVVESHMSAHLPARTREILCNRLTGTVSMRDLTDLAAQLDSGRSLENAFDHLDATARKAVTDWFDRGPDHRQVAEVTALAFARKSDDRTFEAMAAACHKLLDSDPPERTATAENKYPQSRREWSHSDGLIMREVVNSDIGRRSQVDFRSPAYQRHVLRELWDRMGSDYWIAFHTWLDGLKLGTTPGIRSVADGLAVLAEVGFDEARHALDRWSTGSKGTEGQFVCVVALSRMALRDDLAPLSLRIASTWIHDENEWRRWVAAAAFESALGARYPHEATEQLWSLCLRAYDANPDITRVIGNLFTNLTGTEHAGRVLRLLSNELKSENVRRRRVARSIGHAVFTARDGSGRLSFHTFIEHYPEWADGIAHLNTALQHTNSRAIQSIRGHSEMSPFDNTTEAGSSLLEDDADDITADDDDRWIIETNRAISPPSRVGADAATAAFAAYLTAIAQPRTDNRDIP
ncbi:hypothetical protein [Nocardia sp. NPDC050710]|uniref:hypothetical protein n=1 Tax=Nocardia sp. NPDC050710 TaxID=3157220 RepID=UPI0033E99D56